MAEWTERELKRKSGLKVENKVNLEEVELAIKKEQKNGKQNLKHCVKSYFLGIF